VWYQKSKAFQSNLEGRISKGFQSRSHPAFENDRKEFRLYFITDGGLLSVITLSPSTKMHRYV
jgi:hypothetical protein